MDTDNLVQTIYSYLRLVVGSCGAFWGAVICIKTAGDMDWPHYGGILLGGLGLALALNETAYVGARYLAGFIKPPLPQDQTKQEPPA